MARKERKYHYIYKITCLKNERYYIGMHSTDNLEDGYMGGGKRIKNSVKKHGKDAHRKEILEFFENREDLKNREIQLVNEELLSDPMCMNLQPGGGGGFCDSEHYLKFVEGCKNNGKKHRELLNEDLEYRKIHLERWTKILENQNNSGENNNFFNKKHSEETKKRIGETNSTKQKGSRNSQYGTVWINNGEKNRKIKKGEEIPIGWRLGRINIEY